MQLRKLVVSLLMVLASASSFADRDGYRREGRSAMIGMQIRSVALETAEQRNEQQFQQDQMERRRERGFGLPDASGYGTQGDANSSQQENARRQGRMTPEERRALRRQIDEVGHDIYAPKR